MEIIAHRGASHDAPENTLAAARLAWADGADALELDLRLTADAQLAVVHDAELRRLAGTPLQVADATLAELQSLDVGRWKHARFVGEKIPSLPDMLATVPAGKRVFLEVKDGPAAIAPLVDNLAKSAVAATRAVIISFDFAAATAARKALPPGEGEVAWIVDYDEAEPVRIEALIERCRTAALDALDLSARWPLDAKAVELVHRARLKLYVWTVDDPAAARKLVAAGVDGLTTNRPGWLRTQLAR